ncbi:MAG: hypothetical protein ISR55_07215 [Bacteroidetes bacterium]|nr:hypothetical protein [Bacteroidota bacterium]
MKILNKISLILFVLPCWYPISAQNLFNESNSRKYADYLFASGDFKLAAEEFERLNFLHPGNDTFQTRIIQSYRKASNYEFADIRLNSFYPKLNFSLKETAFEYLIIQFSQDRFNQSKSFLQSTNLLNKDEKLFFHLSADLFSAEYEQAAKKLGDWSPEFPATVHDYHQIISDYQHIHFKKQLLAGGLSAMIPGLGQSYAGYWKDGVFAFLFTLSSAYQSYRAFNKGGIKSPYAWIYGALGTGFYVGNIYGAVKSANKYNFNKKKEINNRIEKVFNSYYP